MIIIINGALGVGKTSVSFELLKRFEKAVMLDGDYIGAVQPFDLHDPTRLTYLYQTITHLITFHQSNGYSNFVINYVFETPEELTELVSHLEKLEQKIHCFWLTCAVAEQAQRIRKRGNDQVEWELERFKELKQIQERSSRLGFIGERVRTEEKTITAIVADILERITKRPQL